MKKLTALLMMALLLLTGCQSEKFQDNQVYVADSGSENQEDRFVDWLDVRGQDPFAQAAELPEMAQGELFLAQAPDKRSYYVMQLAQPVRDMAVLDISNVAADLYRIEAESGARELVAQQVPFVTKAAWNQAGEIVAFGGGGHLSVYDSAKGQLILQQELEDTVIDDFFWSPVDKNKLYIEQPDTAGGGLYYVDPQKRVELYETKEKVYYKAHLDKNYYYATQWRNSGGDGDGDLYTVLADDGRRVIKIIGQGIYKDSYLGSVLLLGNDRFGLFLVADINQVSKGFLLTEQYVYDAKFLPGGRIAYITRSEEVRDNRFQLTICAADGEMLQRLAISGSGLLLSPDGRYGCVSGPGAEVIDLAEARLLSQAQTVTAGIDGQLLAALRGASLLYMQQALGQPMDEALLSAYFVDDDRVGMAYSEMLARQSEAVVDSAPVFYQALLDRQHSLIAVNGDVATCHLSLNAQIKGGAACTEQVAWDLLKSGGQWRVAGLSTFCQESGRAAFLQEAEQILQEQGLWPEEGPRWRQVQYWQKDKGALAAWLEEAAWVKIDGEPGGLVLWLTKGEQGQWQLAQLWYNGGWVYPAPAS